MMRMEEIRTKMKRFEVSQKALAVAARLHESQVSDYLSLKKIPRATNRQRIELALAALCSVPPVDPRNRIKVPEDLEAAGIRCVLVQYADGTRCMFGGSDWGLKAMDLE